MFTPELNAANFDVRRSKHPELHSDVERGHKFDSVWAQLKRNEK